MSKWRKKPVVIEANQWFKNGDHPLDGDDIFESGIFKGEKLEGKIVRYFRHPNMPGADKCTLCKHDFHSHGWIDTLEGGHNVCVGDWIITGVKGEHYPCKPDIFEMTYEKVEPSNGVTYPCWQCDQKTAKTLHTPQDVQSNQSQGDE